MKRVLDDAANMFGPLDANIRMRIQRYLHDPSAENWSDIHSILIKPFVTIWQAVILIDPSFTHIGLPHSGFPTDHTERWSKWPDALLVMRAIKAALTPKASQVKSKKQSKGRYEPTHTFTLSPRAAKKCARCKYAPWVCWECGRSCCEHLCSLKKNNGTAICNKCKK